MSVRTVGIQPVHREAARLIAAGQRSSDVTARLNLDSEDLEVVMDIAKRMRAEATPTIPTPLRRPPVQPQPPLAGPAPVADPVADLLAWALTEGSQRAQTLAARVQSSLAELRQLKERDAVTAQARAAVAAAEKALADAKARLRAVQADVKGATAAPTAPRPAVKTDRSTPDPLTYSEEVRDWAKAHGFEVGDRGRMKAAVVDAYRAAHPEAA